MRTIIPAAPGHFTISEDNGVRTIKDEVVAWAVSVGGHAAPITLNICGDASQVLSPDGRIRDVVTGDSWDTIDAWREDSERSSPGSFSKVVREQNEFDE